MKKLFALMIAVMLLCSMTAMAATSVNTTADSFELTGDPAAIKVGVVLIGDENEGYSYAHIVGIQTAAENLGIAPEQIIWKYSIGDDASCYDACADLADAGCDVVFTNSYGHQTYTQQAAAEFPEVQFVAVTGDTANVSGLENLSNAFTGIYQSRFVSGVVAGMKLAQLEEEGKLTAENYAEDGAVKIGYVGAYPYAEVVSGYTAFFLGVRSVFPNVSMSVIYTNDWGDLIAEGEATNSLLSDGCVIIGQHSDTTGPSSATQAALDTGKVAYSVGYNVDMLSVAPQSALTSATNTWAVYYEYALKTAINGEKIATNWAGGYEVDAVDITELGESVAPGTAEKVAETIEGLKSGAIKVFDTAAFTVGGETVTSAFATDTDGDWTNDADEAIIDGAFAESYYQSAPAFALRIDGIAELN